MWRSHFSKFCIPKNDPDYDERNHEYVEGNVKDRTRCKGKQFNGLFCDILNTRARYGLVNALIGMTFCIGKMYDKTE